MYGAPEALAHARRRDTDPAQVTVPLDAAATDGRELAAAACGLTLAMLAEDGVSDPDLLTVSGEIDVDAVLPTRRRAFGEWAQTRGIPIRPRGVRG